MVELVLDETDRRFHKIRASDALRMYVRDPADSAEEAASDEHSRLQWSAVSALDGRPMPVFDVDGMVEDDGRRTTDADIVPPARGSEPGHR